jgi:hypothetical protein
MVDPVEWQVYFNIAVSLIGFILGYMVNRLFGKLDALTLQDAKLTAEINAVKVSLPTNYVTKQDMEVFKRDMNRIASSMFKKLDDIATTVNRKGN